MFSRGIEIKHGLNMGFKKLREIIHIFLKLQFKTLLKIHTFLLLCELHSFFISITFTASKVSVFAVFLVGIFLDSG